MSNQDGSKYDEKLFIEEYSSNPEMAETIFHHIKNFEEVCDNIRETGQYDNKKIVNDIVMDNRELFVDNVMQHVIEYGYADVVDFFKENYTEQVSGLSDEQIKNIFFEKEYSKEGYMVDNLIGNFAINQTANEYFAGVMQELEKDYQTLQAGMDKYFHCVELTNYFKEKISPQLENFGLYTVDNTSTISQIDVNEFNVKLRTSLDDEINSKFSYSCILLNMNDDEKPCLLELSKENLETGNKITHIFNQADIENGKINLDEKRIKLSIQGLQGEKIFTLKTNDFSVADYYDRMFASTGVDYSFDFNNIVNKAVDKEINKLEKKEVEKSNSFELDV